jgi:L-glyceraldehyde 3-phosphate reductase
MWLTMNGMKSCVTTAAGRSGLKLPAISLGLWHNFGGIDTYENGREMITRSFDLGITHFDLANNYGPPAGSAEELFGKVLHRDLLLRTGTSC